MILWIFSCKLSADFSYDRVALLTSSAALLSWSIYPAERLLIKYEYTIVTTANIIEIIADAKDIKSSTFLSEQKHKEKVATASVKMMLAEKI